MVVKVVGPRPERFVNRAIGAGVALFDVRRLSSEMIVAKIGVRDFHRIRALSRQGPWKVTIIKRLGVPFAIRKLQRRKALLLGGLACVLIMAVLSSFVWFVDVQGVVDVPPARILAIARQAGLHPGVAKRAVSEIQVERELLLALPRLNWVNVELRGTLATLNVSERIVPDSDLTLPGDVVAATDGILEKMVTLRGIPMVQEGDSVRAGQLLISGLIPPQTPEHKERIAGGEAPYVRANGIARARVWHEGYAEGALLLREEIPTGRKSRQIIWQLRDSRGTLGALAPFAEFREEALMWQPRLGQWRLPLTLTFLKRAEVQVNEVALDPDTVRGSTLEAAWEQVKAGLRPGAEVHSPPRVEMDTVCEDGQELVRVKVALEALEDIKLFRPLSTLPTGPGVLRTFGSMPKAHPVPGP